MKENKYKIDVGGVAVYVSEIIVKDYMRKINKDPVLKTKRGGESFKNYALLMIEWDFNMRWLRTGKIWEY